MENNKKYNIYDIYVGQLVSISDGIIDGRFGKVTTQIGGKRIFIKNADHGLSGYIDLNSGKMYYAGFRVNNSPFINDELVQFVKFIDIKTLDFYRDGITKEQLDNIAKGIEQSQKEDDNQKNMTLSKRI